jgi:hypothetical protein
MGYVNPNLLVTAVPHAGLVQLADLDENKVTPGLLGFVVFALIGGATWFLMKNMNKQLKKIDFEPGEKDQITAPTSGSSGEAVDARAADGERDPGRS